MPEETDSKTWLEKPYRPIDAAIENRIANALEYIAAQLGEINQKIGAFSEAKSDPLPGVIQAAKALSAANALARKP